MDKNILIVADNEGIIIRGIETKLKSIGANHIFSLPKINDVTSKLTECDLIILCIEENLDKKAEFLVYLKDYCAENEKQIIVVCDDERYNLISQYISDRFILSRFTRPINMDKMLNDIENYNESKAFMTKRKSILIVDDDVSYMSMIMDWLSDNYRVSLANSGMEAITWLASNRPDLILLDYEMPITSGPQVLQMIKSSPNTADIPVMFLTGKSDRESIMAVLELKPVGYLLKTADKQKLNDSIANYFASEKAK